MKQKCFLYAVLLLFSTGFIWAQTSPLEDLYEWQPLTNLPYRTYNASVGVSNEALIVAGGCSKSVLSTDLTSPDGQFIDTIAVLESKTGQWNTQYQLPHPLACAACVSVNDSMIVIGGYCEGTFFDDVHQLIWAPQNKSIAIQTLPKLPHAVAYASAACIGDTVYVFGGIGEPGQPVTGNAFLALDLSEIENGGSWQVLSTPSEVKPRYNPTVISQSNGEKDALFIFGGKQLEIQSNGSISKLMMHTLNDAWRFEPFERDPDRQWAALESSPVSLEKAFTFTVGQTHIFFGDKDSLYAYHTITNTWVPAGEQPPCGATSCATAWNDMIVALAESKGDPSATAVISGSLKKVTPQFGMLNYLTLGSYLAGMVLVGVYFSKREKSVHDFFLAGKRIPGWAAGISIYATTFSAISMIGTPSKVFATNWLYFLASVAVLPVMPFVIYCFIPFVRKLDVTTAYEYLEKRFNSFVRLFGSLVFILFQLGRMAIVLLLPSLALSTVTGINIQVCILSMGVLCIIYTVLGGIEAVIWTDVLQFIVLLGGIILSFIIIINDIDGGLSTFFSTARSDHKFEFVLLSWDYTVPAIWVAMIGNCLSNISPYLTDQSVVQRYMTTPDLKQAKNSLWFNFFFTLPNTILVFSLGTALYVFYKHNPGLLNPTLKTDAVFPLFIVQKMPAGLCGLVIAGIFAASMSSLDSAMHSVATAIINDFYLKISPDSSEHRRLVLARWTTGLLGVFGTAAAVVLSMHNLPSLWDFFMTLLGLLGGGITGVFLLGIFTRRTHGPGAFIGAIVSGFLVFIVQKYTGVHFFLYGAIGVISAMIVGYLASIVIPIRQKDISGLTMYTLNK